MSSVSEIVTEKIIEQLSKGVIPWVKPWASARAINYVTRKPYRGVNIMLLDAGEYLTFNQAKDAGGNIKKGAKAKMVVFWKTYAKGGQDKDQEPEETSDKMSFVLRYYNLFHLSDCEGIESKLTADEKERTASIPDKDKFASNYMSAEGITYEQSHSNKAYYTCEADSIHLPLTEQFTSAGEYYSTLFHEMTHSTGNKARLNRLDLAQYHSSKEVRSREELTAEIGAASLMSECGLENAGTLKNSSAYIQSWIRVLKDDCNMIMQASSRAQKAIDYIISKTV